MCMNGHYRHVPAWIVHERGSTDDGEPVMGRIKDVHILADEQCVSKGFLTDTSHKSPHTHTHTHTHTLRAHLTRTHKR